MQRSIFAIVSVLIVFTTGQAAPLEKAPAPAPLTAERLDEIWKTLGRSDDEGAQQALEDVRLLTRTPALVVPFLSKQLKPLPAADSKRIAQSIADLDSSEFASREKAMKDLEAMGVQALPLLEKKLQDKDVSLEARTRLRQLVQRAEAVESRGPSADELRSLRAIEVLRGIGTIEAKAVLRRLSTGDEASVLTLQARRALGQKK